MYNIICTKINSENPSVLQTGLCQVLKSLWTILRNLCLVIVCLISFPQPLLNWNLSWTQSSNTPSPHLVLILFVSANTVILSPESWFKEVWNAVHSCCIVLYIKLFTINQYQLWLSYRQGSCSFEHKWLGFNSTSNSYYFSDCYSFRQLHLHKRYSR